MKGEVGILNVGAGDTKLVFDPSKPEEMKRAANIVEDMLRRGFAIFIEVEKDGRKIHRRVRKFRKATCEYIIGDLPKGAAPEGATREQTDQAKPAAKSRQKRRGGRNVVTIPAGEARAVAVARTAGG